MGKTLTNEDRILQAILNNAEFAEKAGYNPADFSTLNDALESENVIVNAVAQMIKGQSDDATKREVYNQINNYLISNNI